MLVYSWVVGRTSMHSGLKVFYIYSLSRKTVNTRENFWNVYCFATNQKRDETATDNRQTAACISHDLIRNNELAFSSNELAFLPRLTFKKPNYWIQSRPRSKCKLSKFAKIYMVQVFGWRLLSYKKSRIENHQSQPTGMTFWTACETHWSAPLLIGLLFFCSQTRCLALSDPTISTWFNIAFP